MRKFNTKAYFKKQKTEYLKRQLRFIKQLGGMKTHKKDIEAILKKRRLK